MEREVYDEAILKLREVGENPEFSDATRIEALKIMYRIIDEYVERGVHGV